MSKKIVLRVIKIGGNILDDEGRLDVFLHALASLPGAKILVHGGGKLATQLAEKLGVPQTMVEGRRITDAETLRIATMVYGGLVNKQLVAKLHALGCPAPSCESGATTGVSPCPSQRSSKGAFTASMSPTQP